MSTDDHWITNRVTEARTRHPSVTEAISSRMAELLKGQLSKHQLSPKELTRIAKEFTAGMVPPSPKTDAKR